MFDKHQSPEMNAEIERLVELLATESPRGNALMGGEMVNEALRALLIRYLSHDTAAALFDDAGGSLHEFGARNKLAFALGIIDKPIHDDIKSIQKIRNQAAHFYRDKKHTTGFDFDFNNDGVRSLVLGLSVLPSELRDHFKTDPRQLYNTWVSVVVGSTSAIILDLNSLAHDIPKLRTEAVHVLRSENLVQPLKEVANTMRAALERWAALPEEERARHLAELEKLASDPATRTVLLDAGLRELQRIDAEVNKKT